MIKKGTHPLDIKSYSKPSEQDFKRISQRSAMSILDFTTLCPIPVIEMVTMLAERSRWRAELHNQELDLLSEVNVEAVLIRHKHTYKRQSLGN